MSKKASVKLYDRLRAPAVHCISFSSFAASQNDTAAQQAFLLLHTAIYVDNAVPPCSTGAEYSLPTSLANFSKLCPQAFAKFTVRLAICRLTMSLQSIQSFEVIRLLCVVDLTILNIDNSSLY